MIKTPVCWPILLRGPPRFGLPISGYTALELLKGDNKMNMKQLCTATDRSSRRERINFRMEEKQIKKLRRRMVRAYRLYELESVAVLQGWLVHSFGAKVLAIKTGLIYRIFHRAEGMEVKNMEHENFDFIESELFNEIAQSFDEPCAIEYLGIAKNAIVDAKNTETALPVFLAEKLSRAYALLDEAQEALYNN